MKTVTLTEGVTLRTQELEKFKTTLVTFNIYTREEESEAGISAFLSGLLSCGYPEYRTLSELNKKLDSLYGASLFGTASKCGDLREIKLGFRGLKEKYTEGSVIEELAELLMKLVFGIAELKELPKDIFDREKEIFNKKRLAAKNEKRSFARSRCEEEAAAGEPFGFSLYGSDESVASITSKTATEKVRELLEKSDIIINLFGAENEQRLTEIFNKYFSKIKRNYKPVSSDIVKATERKKEVVDNQDIAQGKLVMAFRSASPEFQNNSGASRLLCDIFGGGPYSKLFNNVREKKSLCYYCSARAVRKKGLIFVESGVDFSNIEAAKNAIIQEFEDMKAGKISDDELDFSKKGLTDFLMSAADDELLFERWYSIEGTAINPESPEQVALKVKNSRKEEITALANTFSLDTVYILKNGEAK